MDGRTYDGHTAIFGQDTSTDPSYLDADKSAKAVNRSFRGGRNCTRPPFWHLQFEFDDMSIDWEDVIRHGNYQGGITYKKRKPGRLDGTVVSIAGNIFFLRLVNEICQVKLIYTGNDPRLMHTWFCQAEEWLYIQNGKDRPIFWDGLFPSEARRSDPDKNEMPVGTIMAYIHGRVFVSNAFDQIAASDIVYGNSLTTSDNTQRFTENLYWNEGGYLGLPADIGHITGMIVVPRQDNKLNGQGELLVLAENGATSIEAGFSRSQWKDIQIQTITLTGRGNESPWSVITVNNDVFFRSADGLASYTITRSEQKNRLSFGKLSRHVNAWMDEESDYMLQFVACLYFDNRVLTTVGGVIEPPSKEEYGVHRYFRGMVALDLDEASDVQGDSSFNWDGLWTGIRPCGLLKDGIRALAWSHDEDGENRLYEIKKNGLNDKIEGQAVQTEWLYLTKRFDWKDTGRTNSFEVKRFVGGELWISDLRDRIEIGVDYRPDNIPTWTEAMPPYTVGNDFHGELLFSLTRARRIKLTTPKEVCIQGNPYPSNHGSQHQFMVYGMGDVKIDRLRMAMAATNDPNSPVGDCELDNPKIEVDGKLENDYHYLVSEHLTVVT